MSARWCGTNRLIRDDRESHRRAADRRRRTADALRRESGAALDWAVALAGATLCVTFVWNTYVPDPHLLTPLWIAELTAAGLIQAGLREPFVFPKAAVTHK